MRKGYNKPKYSNRLTKFKLEKDILSYKSLANTIKV